MENPCGRNFIRGVAAGWVESAVVIAGAVMMSSVRFQVDGRRTPVARMVRPRAGDHALRRGRQISTMGMMLPEIATEARCCGGPRSNMRDDEGMPLICPTCQLLFSRNFVQVTG
ncbi:hypothetical protein [Bradyrhizobium sp.]|uniref:hypothetical protein n=1 Tax=Bradyrhizobium sp. TaxID=376 RepID=UPI00273252D5|nr:hypothetical protein [Bradyrhizobium sp.]MDP3074196.1 hypothetical protein [Bradyrhizobium sp.]